jgi:microcystin-dependent protein
MIKGTTWTGDYSRFSFDETKNYLMVLKERGVPLLDDEVNLIQEMTFTYLRRLTLATLGDGCFDLGFKIVERVGVANSFVVTAGRAVRDGWMVNCATNTNYESQPVAPPSLVTPGVTRIDNVYLDIYYDEINGTEDANSIDPTLGVQVGCRLKLNWRVLVAEGTSVPADGLDANDVFHWRYKIATLNRTSSSMITAAMIVDNRRTIKVPTADGNMQTNLNSDMLDGYHANAGAVAATIPVRGGDGKIIGAITGDAATLGGNPPGNNTGNVPVSNGTRCVNLNADLLDGKHSSEFSQPGHTHPGTDVTSKVATAGTADSSGDSDKLDGQHGAYYQDASNLTAGTLPDGRFPAVLPIASGANLTLVNADRLDGYHASDIPLLWPIPVGCIHAFAGPSDKIPTGWLVCNGQEVNRSEYAALFAVIGVLHGSTSGTTFKVPDVRGVFIRGLDQGRTSDPDSNRTVGSYQADTIQNFTGQIGTNTYGAGLATGVFTNNGVSYSTYNSAAGAAGGNTVNFSPASAGARVSVETRPKNLALIHIIKA